MYLDAMQQVLSASSKIIVDGKAGNLMYLPLDKLAINPPKIELSQADLVKREALLNQEDNNALLDGRATTRPVERQGRND